MNTGVVYIVRCGVAIFVALVVMEYFHYLPGAKRFKSKNKLLKLGLGTGIAVVLFVADIFFDNSYLLSGFLFLTSLAVVILFYKGALWLRLVSAVIPAVISLLADLFVYSIEINLGDIPLGGQEHDGAYVVRILAAKLLLFVIIKVICSFYKKRMTPSVWKYWYGLLAVPFCSIILLLKPVAQVLNSREPMAYNIIAGIALLYINVAVFTMFDQLLGHMENKQQLIVSQQALHLEKRHFKELEKNRQAIRSIWHDMNNHISTMRTLVNDGDYENLCEYLNGLENEVREILHFIDTGNPVIDAALNEKYLRARRAGVVLEISAMIPALLDLDPLNIVCILSNALDNAIESTSKLELSRRVVTILLNYKNGFLGLSIKNPTDGMLFESTEGQFQTDKEDKISHGFGLKNIRHAVDQLEGQLKVTHINDVFSVDVVVAAEVENRQTTMV